MLLPMEANAVSKMRSAAKRCDRVLAEGQQLFRNVLPGRLLIAIDRHRVGLNAD